MQRRNRDTDIQKKMYGYQGGKGVGLEELGVWD